MKDPKSWGIDELNELIATQAEESSSLEFKHGRALEDLSDKMSSDKRKKEISIDVSAFANRSGGTIIYGMEEESAEPHPAKGLAPVDPKNVPRNDPSLEFAYEKGGLRLRR